jgi:thiamine biosynthesis lipoprotein
VTDKAMATSGNYRRFYYKGGKRYAHTIDPKTGYPVQHNILSATVLARDCATADAYATSFMVLGLEGAKRILERHPELMAYLIYSDKDNNLAVWYSPSMKEKIEQ